MQLLEGVARNFPALLGPRLLALVMEHEPVMEHVLVTEHVLQTMVFLVTEHVLQTMALPVLGLRIVLGLQLVPRGLR
jgi:urea transporter